MMRSVSLFLWAFPLALIIHIFEEFAFPGGFVRWIRLYNSRRIKPAAYYVVVNSAAIAGAVAIALFAKDRVGYWVYLYSVALMAGNATSHLRAAYQQRKYCPGSLTGAFVLIPLLGYSSWFFLDHAVIGRLPGLVAIGIGLLIGFSLFAVDSRKQRPTNNAT